MEQLEVEENDFFAIELFGEHLYFDFNEFEYLPQARIQEAKEEEIVEKGNEEPQQLIFDNIVDFNNLTFENDSGQSFMSHGSPDQPTPLCREDPFISGNFLFPFSFSFSFLFLFFFFSLSCFF